LARSVLVSSATNRHGSEQPNCWLAQTGRQREPGLSPGLIRDLTSAICEAPALGRISRHTPDGACAGLQRRWDYGSVLTRLRGRMQDAAPVVRRSPLRARLGPPSLVAAGSGLERRRGIRVSLTSAQALQSRLQRPGCAKTSRQLAAKPRRT
jgi:hypothetical protein